MLLSSDHAVKGQLSEPSGDKRLRIAMIAACPFPYPRGTPIRIYRMAEALADRGHEVHVVTYHLGEEITAPPFRLHRIRRVPTYRKASPGPTYQKLFVLDALLYRALGRVLREHEIDLIHAHHYEGLLVADTFRAGRRPPIIYDAHTLLGSELPFYRLGLSRRLKRGIGRLLDKHLPGRADHVISVTSVLRDRLVEIGAVADERISVVENGVELSRFEVPPVVGPVGEKTIVFAGNLAPYQGIELMLNAFRNVVQQENEVRLKIVTESSFEAYEVLARSVGIRERIEVLHLGFDQLPGHLRSADVAVNPRAICDGVPQKLLNYMAAGCPIVSFAGSAAHLVHGRTGWIVNSGDTAAMADGILHLLRYPALARALGNAARTQVKADYGWDKTALRAEAVYDRVLAGKSSLMVDSSPNGSY